MISDPSVRMCKKTVSETTTVLARFNTTWVDSSGQTSTFLHVFDKNTVLCSTGGCTTVPLKSETVISSAVAFASPTFVYWHSSDLAFFPEDYASSLAAVMSVPFGNPATPSSLLSTTLSSTDSSSVPPRASPSPNSGLSPGAKAGIGVGVCVSVIIGVVFLLFLWRRRKRQRQQQKDTQQQEQEQETSAQIGVAEIDGDARDSKRFVGGHWRAETDGTSAPVEAGSTSVHIISGPPVELDATHARDGG